jgi:hypothetical protein
MKPKLSKSAIQLREQIDDAFADRDRRSDSGIYSDARHAARKSDHNADVNGWVHALDISRGLSEGRDVMPDLVDQIRLYAKKHGRFSYIIFNNRIASPILNWRWRKYTGVNPHIKHAHFSFSKDADLDGSFYKEIPMIGENR